MAKIFAFTDGACSGNPGPGGWGALLQAKDGDTVTKERELKGGEAMTTNNRMELMAAIAALEALGKPSKLTVVTDSAYVKGGITEWMAGWKRKGWRTSTGKPVKNEDLWRRLDEAAARHDVTWTWVKGHAGHPENERADELARAGMAPFKPGRARA
ncbi:MAG: ribonuclease HI [Limimaricola soesokkakensis]|uniref:Ribonuclease H n=1 Tax=Limimaricola soesokkakensis TaxID=1343159 RepID=A0A1X6YJ18_9RHOB|nr:ribonuclease HI [Limimaricola soesokkakensis]PSK88555.1 ribonuclease HI [Limimaricola soesokkakensis]SLN23181.1 Ribonuclease HI [Limimaricola soesokkakensis]